MYPKNEGKSMHNGFIKPFIYVIQMFLSIDLDFKEGVDDDKTK